MAIFLNLCSAASVLGLLAIAGSDLGISPPVGVARETHVVRMTGRPAPKASFAAPVVFNAYARSKVVQYFDTYRSEPIELPSGSEPRVGIGGMPAEWEGPEIVSGRVIPESERAFLVDVPVELVRVLAAQSQVVVRYYLAGNSLVAVDPGYKVMDVVRIPTARVRDEQKLVARVKEVRLVGYGNRR
ncbi:MAG: hypothetical protein ABI162_11710 [Luteolibacter sp.]